MLDFDLHPDMDANRNIPVEIQFGNFQNLNGWLVPFQIQKYLQGSLMLDLVITNVSINSGVPSSIFTLPTVPVGGAQ